jgi:hypothetical protein
MSNSNEIQHPKKEAMIQALEKHLGVVTTACKTVDIDRTTHYRWLKEDEAYKEATEDIDNVSLDFAESQLLKQIKDGNTTATIFFLKTRGKHRGYVERLEQLHSGEIKLPSLKVEVISPDESK